MPGGLAHGQEGGVSGSGAGCEENTDKTGYDCEYGEEGTGPVATFTATDPERGPVSWDLDTTGGAGADHVLFRISKDGVLTFKASPNFEASDTDNMHEVTVRATDNAYGIAGTSGVATRKLVMIEVTNVEEPGKVTLTVNGETGQPVLQPQMGEELTAALSDGDTPTGIAWKWYRGSTEIIGATGTGEMSTYTPVQADIDSRLTAKATYTDEKDSDVKDMAEDTTIMAVRAAPESNNAPTFPDENPSTPDIVDKTPERKVAENTPSGRNIGAPVKANDEGDVVAYSLGGDDAGLFAIDIATGQLKTKGKLNRETLTDRDTSTAESIELRVTVTAVDPFGQFDTATVTIKIENENESPVINERDARTMLMYPEPLDNPDPTVLLWTYEATDDEDDAGTVVALSWKLEGADRSKLVIGNTTSDLGQLKFLKNPNFEKPVDSNKDNVYEVTVVVTDSRTNSPTRWP